jgi:acyl-CoA thioesterase FadM
MYPFIRMAKAFWEVRNAPELGLFDTHVSRHRCWPWDIDIAMELNNGRTLTLLDLGRIPLAHRLGLLRVLKEQKWGLTMAGVTVRYRRRIRTFEAFTMKSRLVCWDERFTYLEQCMINSAGEVANHAIYRAAATDKNGIVATQRLTEALGNGGQSPPIPDFIQSWIETEAKRPWPPMQE